MGGMDQESTTFWHYGAYCFKPWGESFRQHLGQWRNLSSCVYSFKVSFWSGKLILKNNNCPCSVWLTSFFLPIFSSPMERRGGGNYWRSNAHYIVRKMAKGFFLPYVPIAKKVCLYLKVTHYPASIQIRPHSHVLRKMSAEMKKTSRFVSSVSWRVQIFPSRRE